MMNIKTLAVPALVAMSVVFTGCASSQIEAPDAVDGAIQDGIEGVEQGATEAGDAVQGGLENLQKGAKDAGAAIEDGAKGIQKGAEDAAGTAKEGIEEGIDNAGNAVEELGDNLSTEEAQ